MAEDSGDLRQYLRDVEQGLDQAESGERERPRVRESEEEKRLYRELEERMKRAESEGGRRRYPRRFVIKAGTLAAIGGATALPALLAACGGGGGGGAKTSGGGGGSPAAGAASTGGDITGAQFLAPLADGQFKYSRYPLVEKYNWRNLQWGGTPTHGGNLIPNPLQPPNWNPFTTPSLNSYGGRLWSTLGRILYGPNVDMEKVTLQGDLAAKWPPDASPDGTSFTYQLTQGVKFANLPPANGRELVAEDVKANYEAYAQNSVWKALLTAMDHIETPDKYTVKFVMKEPAAYWPAYTSMPTIFIVPPEMIGKNDQLNSSPVGSGPFTLKEAPQQDHFLMVRNPDYFHTDSSGYHLPYIDSTRQNWITDYAVELAAYRSGQQDWTGPPNLTQLHAIVTSVGDSIIEVIPQDPAVQAAVVFQMKNPIFQDPRVRRAMSLAIDRAAIIKTAWQGAAVPAEPVPFDYQGLTEPLQLKDQGDWVKYDPEQAKQLLQQAGHGGGFHTTLIYPNTLATDYLTAYQQCVAYWQKVGITVDLNVQESTTYLQTQLNKSFDGLIGIATVAGYDGDSLSQQFHDPSPLNYGSWSDSQTEDFLKKERATLDANARQQVFRDFNKYLLDQVPAIYMGSRHRMVALHPWVRGIEDDIHSWGGYWGSWQQSIAWLLPEAPGGRGGKQA